jgi:hypothetical protein
LLSLISRGLSTGPNGEKVVLFGLSTGTKIKFLFVEYYKFTYSTDTKSEKYHFFAISTGTMSPGSLPFIYEINQNFY